MIQALEGARAAVRVRRLLAGAALIVLGCASSASAATPTWRSGVFAGYGPSADQQFGGWRGAPIQTATDFIASDNWTNLQNPVWTISQWAAVPSVQPDLSVAMWPATGGNLASAASGAYNSYFRTLAQNLVNGALPAASIRLGWEFNGTWYRWSVATAADAANYAAAWRQIVTAMRSVRGQRFSFDWSPTQSSGGVNPALAYPGNAYVTDIGLDVYDWNPTYNAKATDRWNALLSNGYGLAWQASFAAAHGKPIAFPEWGLVYYSPYPPVSGGDDPAFIQNMHNWFASHNTAFENYSNFDDPTNGFYYGLTTGSGQFPQSTALYHQLFGN
jgi:hypothetical protein